MSSVLMFFASFRTQAEVNRVDRLAEEIGIIQSLKNAFDPILNVVLLALDAPPVFMRTKALRALSQILAVDSSVLTSVRLHLFRLQPYQY